MSAAQTLLDFDQRTDAQREFDEWIETNKGQETYRQFYALALSLRKRGFRRYSSRDLFARLRWHCAMVYGADDDGKVQGFKVCNNWSPRLARYVEERHAELAGFFAKKKLKGQE